MQCACAILSSVACPAIQTFSTLSYKWQDFRGGEKKKVTNMRHASIFSTYMSTTFLILSRNDRDMIKNVLYWSSCKVSIILV